MYFFQKSPKNGNTNSAMTGIQTHEQWYFGITSGNLFQNNNGINFSIIRSFSRTLLGNRTAVGVLPIYEKKRPSVGNLPTLINSFTNFFPPVQH